MTKCVICNKKLSKGPFSKNKKFELLNHDCICRGCAFRIGITNELDAATYTAKKARDEYIELYPAEVGLCSFEVTEDNGNIVKEVNGNGKVKPQKNSSQQLKSRKKYGCLVPILICVLCLTVILTFVCASQSENAEKIMNTVRSWVNNMQENISAGKSKLPTITDGKKWIEEKLDIASDDDPVEIYHAVLDFEGVGAEAYLTKLREENPEKQYRYFNEEYFIETITEGERKAILEQIKNADAYFTEAFVADYPGMFIKAEVDRNLDALTLHFNRKIYEENPFTGFAILISGSIYMNSLDAYNLVPPEDREIRIVCVDENGEILMDSDTWEKPVEEPAVNSTIASVEYPLVDHVVVDNESCVFTVKNIDPAGDWGFTLNVCCENKTDNSLMFSWDDVSVMGFMVDPFWATEVTAGNKANATIHFSYDLLDLIGIESVDDITFTLRVSDRDDWSAEPVLEEEYAIYPTGKSIQDITYPTRKNSDTEVVLYDNDEYSVIVLSNESEGGDFLMHYYLENKTGHDIMFSMDAVSVNGYMADPFWGASVAAGKKLYATACFYESLLTDNGIESVEGVEFTMRVSNAKNWDTHASEVFTYIP